MSKVECGEWNVITPRFSPDGKKIVFVTSGKVHYHDTCYRLNMMDWSTKKVSVVVDYVSLPTKENGGFPGLYLAGRRGLTHDCWINNDCIMINTLWGSLVKVLKIDIPSGKITELNSEFKDRSMLLLDHFNGYLLVKETSPILPFRVIFGKYNENFVCKWKVVENSLNFCNDKVSTILKEMEFIRESFVPSHGPKDVPVDLIILKPKGEFKEKKLKLLIYPHGGPHSCYVSEFYFNRVYFASFGFALCLVNYRGSTGFGMKCIESLPSHVGDMDVKDVFTATQYMKNKDYINKDLISIAGGSHGGFLTCHVVGQYPKLFKSAVAFNPVTDITTMVAATDIPDWCYSTCGFNPYKEKFPTSEFYKRAFESSPMNFVKNVVTPTLVLLGGADRRVPNTQGKSFYFALKRLGVTTKLKVYPDNNHSLAGPQENADSLISCLLWLLKYLKKV